MPVALPGLKVLNWNANGLHAKELESFITDVSEAECWDFILLHEACWPSRGKEWDSVVTRGATC